jgi:hypothetical protein
MTRRAWSDYIATQHVQPPLFEPPAQPKRRARGKTRHRAEPLEKDIQRVILSALRLHPKVARIERTNTGAGKFQGKNGKAGRFIRFGFPGQPDLTGIANDGRVIAIEIKRPSTRHNVSTEQRAYLDQVSAAGGYAGVATCVEEAFAILGTRGADNGED